jgi:MFS family permease
MNGCSSYKTEPSRATVFLDFRNLLLWIFCLDLASLVFACATAHRQIFIYYGVSSVELHLHIDLLTILVRSFLWGGVLMCHAACENFAGLIVVRFLLGVGEAAMAPGCALITGMFYTRQEQPLR